MAFDARRRRPAALLRLSLLPVLLLLLATAAPALAQAPADPASFAARIADWQAALDRASAVLVRGDLAESDYDGLRVGLTGVFDEARGAGGEAAEAAGMTRQLLDSLGPGPAEGEAPEAEAVAAERARLAESLTELEGQTHQAALIATRADILLRTANERRVAQFAETLFRRGVSPVSPATWDELPAQFRFVRDRTLRAVAALDRAGLPWRERLAAMAGLAVVAAGVIGWTRRRWLNRLICQKSGARSTTGAAMAGSPGAEETAAGPSYRERVIVAGIDTVLCGVVPAGLIVAAAMMMLDALEDLALVALARAIVIAAAAALATLVAGAALAHALLTPHRPEWRVIGLTDGAARALALRLSGLAAALGLAGAIMAFTDMALVAPELHAVAGFTARLAGAMGVLAVLSGRLWQRPAGPVPAPAAGEAVPPAETVAEREAGSAAVAHGTGFRWRLVVAMAVAAVVVLAALGFERFSRYIAELALAGTALAGLLLLVRGLGHELVSGFLRRPVGPVARLRGTLLHSERGRLIFDHAARALLDLALVLAGLAVLLPLAGVEWSELRGWGATFLRGVTIGEITLAPGDLLSAVVLVVGIMAGTRFVQRTLDERLLRRLHLDRGIQHSIRTGIGYLGMLLALLVGVATLGINLSSLALIAGALSVGIGFGLQNVVSNFVAGLILLVERPVKVGDWVVVGGNEGVVKRISVRATELQTFHRSSVIIPNSELVSSAVVNWTHKDKYGRIDVAVGVAYDSDVESVRTVLLDCARADARVARVPPPQVVFRDFGDSALNFELRCFVPDVDVFIAVSSDLRFAIFKAFRTHGIEIPFPQRVMHWPHGAALAERLATAAVRPDGAGNGEANAAAASSDGRPAEAGIFAAPGQAGAARVQAADGGPG